MPLYQNEREVLERASQLRRDHMELRTIIAAKCALDLAYGNGQQWTRLGFDPARGGLTKSTLTSSISPRAREVRVTDNQIGPIVRSTVSRTTPEKLDVSVRPAAHDRGMAGEHRASVAQAALNGLEPSIAATRTAARASQIRWMTGNALLLLRLSRRRGEVDGAIVRNPDGSPVTFEDQWLRWELGYLWDLVWDPSNESADLDDHSVLMYERVLTLRQFHQLYGDPKAYGLDEDKMPSMRDMAPYAVQAASIDGSGIFEFLRANSDQKAVREVWLIESDPRDPQHWPEHYLVFDTTPTGGRLDVQGRVVNMEMPRTAFGSHGRNIFKLDAYLTGVSVFSWSIPRVLIGQQDMLNCVESTKLGLLFKALHGYWLYDERSAPKQSFIEQVNSVRSGGVLTWNSGGDRSGRPPEWVQPANAVSPDYLLLEAAHIQRMQGQAHIADLHRGIAKTHVPQDVAQRALSQADSVPDMVIARDKATLSDAMKVTLATLVKAAGAGPTRMIGRLRDAHGFAADDLATLLEINPRHPQMVVAVREDSMVRQPLVEKKANLDLALQAQLISPAEYHYAMAADLERPLTTAHRRSIEFVARLVVGIMNGTPFRGLPSLDTELFTVVATRARDGLDWQKPEDRKRMAMLEVAMDNQRSVGLELAAEVAALQSAGGAGGAAGVGAPPSPAALPPARGFAGSAGRRFAVNRPGPAPASIDPERAPVGAAGGLRLGL